MLKLTTLIFSTLFASATFASTHGGGVLMKNFSARPSYDLFGGIGGGGVLKTPEIVFHMGQKDGLVKSAYGHLEESSNGTATKDSDYDFVMVVPNPKKSTLYEMSKARSLVFKKHLISAAIFIYSEKEFDDWKDELGSIPETALNTGIEIPLTKNPRQRSQG